MTTVVAVARNENRNYNELYLRKQIFPWELNGADSK